MAKLTNGKTIVEVADERAHELALKMGYRIVTDPQPQPPIPEPRKPRGRPKKAS